MAQVSYSTVAHRSDVLFALSIARSRLSLVPCRNGYAEADIVKRTLIERVHAMHVVLRRPEWFHVLWKDALNGAKSNYLEPC